MSIYRLNTRHRPFARRVDSHQIADIKSRYWVNQLYIPVAWKDGPSPLISSTDLVFDMAEVITVI